MDARALEHMADVEDRHWWWSGRRAILGAVVDDLAARGLPPGVLYDLGCGVGSNLAVLARHGEVVGVDGSRELVEAAQARGRAAVRHADLEADGDALRAYPEGSAALVLMADVLEHLDDEAAALRQVVRLLAPGGAFVATVPALPALWGPSDEWNHHRRRYTRSSLRAAVAPHLGIERLTYFNTLLLPPIALGRALSRAARRPGGEEVGLPPAPVNALLTRLFSAERHLLSRRDLPLGVSLLCVARKARR